MNIHIILELILEANFIYIHEIKHLQMMLQLMIVQFFSIQFNNDEHVVTLLISRYEFSGIL